MATVKSKTSIKIDELIESTIIGGEIVNGHLILTNRGGAQIDAGVVTDVGQAVSPLDFMPIGYIYMSVVPTSPATLFGGGTWVRIGQGRVLVGQDPAQTEFDTVEETGGEKQHTISSAELPSHTHSNNHNHPFFQSNPAGQHTHILTRKAGTGTSSGVARGNSTASADGTTEAEPDHTHGIQIAAYTGTSGATGSGTPSNNLQPYLVVYMWKRTA